jgi:6-phosphofructokinase 2
MHPIIITLTVNPVVEKHVIIEGFIPEQRLNCSFPTYRAGGGGINVSRAIKNLGGSSTAIYLAGGRTGNHLQSLLREGEFAKKGFPFKTPPGKTFR